MKRDRLFKQVLRDCIPCPSMFLSKNAANYFLINFLNNTIYFHKLSEADVEDFNIEKRVCLNEVFSFSNKVVGLFKFEESFYILDEEGNLFILNEEKSSNNHLTSRFVRRLLKESDSVISYYEISDLLIVLVNSSISLQLKVFEISTGEERKSLNLQIPGVVPNLSNCIIHWIPTAQVQDEFLKNWFPSISLNAKSEGVVVISTPAGNIYSVFVQSGEVEHLYSWPFPLIFFKWCILANTETSCIQENTLIFLFANGTLVILDQYGGILNRFLPVDRVSSCVLSGDSLYVSDSINCFRFSIYDEKKTHILPLKGVTCWGSVENGFVLALTRHGTLYSICDEVSEASGSEPPSSNLIEQLSISANHLEALGNQLIEADIYITAASLALKKCSFSMTGQIVAITGTTHTVRVYIESVTREAIFEAGIWFVSIGVECSKCKQTFSQELKQTLNSVSPFCQLFSFQIPASSGPPLILSVCLICHRGEGRYRPFVPVGQMTLDASYFLQPSDHIELARSTLPKEPSLEELLGDEKMTRRSELSEGLGEDVTLKLQLHCEIPGESFFQGLLTNSRALWRTSSWASACDPEIRELVVLLCGHIVRLGLKEKEVVIQSKDLYACHCMKLAVLRFMCGTKEKEIAEDCNTLFNKVEDILQSLEMLMFKDESDSVGLHQLHQKLREISCKFTE